MFHGISERIIMYAVKNNAVDKEKAAEYIYGLELSLSVLLSYLSVIIIGAVMGMLWQSILFLFLFVSIRRFAGGFHFKSQVMCYLCTCIICTAAFSIIKYSSNNILSCTAVMVLSTLLLLIISPIPAIEKSLDDKEKIIYGRVSRVILIIIAAAYAVLYFTQNVYIAKVVAVAILTVAALAICGKIKYELCSHKGAA